MKNKPYKKLFSKTWRALLFFVFTKNKSAKKRFSTFAKAAADKGKKGSILIGIKKWCAARESNPHAGAKDPKSFVSANSTSRAYLNLLLI